MEGISEGKEDDKGRDGFVGADESKIKYE